MAEISPAKIDTGTTTAQSQRHVMLVFLLQLKNSFCFDFGFKGFLQKLEDDWCPLTVTLWLSQGCSRSLSAKKECKQVKCTAVRSVVEYV